MRLLSSSTEIAAALQSLFLDDVPKLALVAFVGKDGPSFLPDGVTQLRVVCWPKAGGTHPEGVNALLARHHVQFCERLHSKIYWAEGRGMIVGSANLSRNALGTSGLDEYAVLLEDGLPTSEDLLAPLSGRLKDVTPESLQALRVEHRRYWQRNAESGGTGSQTRAATGALSFTAYLNQAMPARWKIITYSEPLSAEEEETRVRAPLEESTGSRAFYNYNEVSRGEAREGEFLLQVKTSKDGRLFLNRPKCKWFYVDKVLGGVAIQISKRHPVEPFELSDSFRNAFCRVGNARDWDAILDRNKHVTGEFMHAVQAAMR